MSFPSDVAERALLDCARHCCTCHRFCGFKIELHHIEQRADEGQDTYDNCIPLCFDCHAEVKAYNPRHPKGRKYTESELKGHRDRWYEKVRNSHATSANPDYIELDRKTFLEIQKILPSTGSISFVRRQDYGSSFPREQHANIRTFVAYCERPEFEFMDTDLEGLRARLAGYAEEFGAAIGEYTSPLDNNIEWNCVPREWSVRHPEMFHQAVNKLNGLADKICTTYDELIRLGRRKLAV